MKLKPPEQTAANKKGIFWEPAAKVTAGRTRGGVDFTVSNATTVDRYSVERKKDRRVEW